MIYKVSQYIIQLFKSFDLNGRSDTQQLINIIEAVDLKLHDAGFSSVAEPIGALMTSAREFLLQQPQTLANR